MTQPERPKESAVPKLLGGLLVINALIILSGTLLKRFPDALQDVVPFNVTRLSRHASLLAAFLLLYFARNVYKAKRNAYILSMAVLLGVVAFELMHPRNPVALLFSLMLVVTLWWFRRYFNTRSDVVRLRSGFRLAGLLTLVAFCYGIGGFYWLNEHRNTALPPRLKDAAVSTAQQLWAFDPRDVTVHTRRGRVFLDSLDLAGLSALTLVCFSMFRPIRFLLGPSAVDHESARAILGRFSTTPDDFFKLWPHDKHYFFDSGRTAFVTYKVENHVAVALGDPTGPVQALPSLLDGFKEFCRLNDWAICFLHTSSGSRQLLEDKGFSLVLIGQEAFINLEAFLNMTARDKHFRYVRNKHNKAGYRVELWQPPQSLEHLADLKQVSLDWLSQGDRREYGFALGYFDGIYLSGCVVAVVLDNGGRLMAFANLLPPLNNSTQASVDLMRYRPDALPGAMHYLFMELFGLLAAQGYKTFNLGFTPLKGLADKPDPTSSEQLLKLSETLGERFFSVKGLQQFKNKFDPDWQDSYFAYGGGTVGLVRTVLASLRALNRPSPGSKRHKS